MTVTASTGTVGWSRTHSTSLSGVSGSVEGHASVASTQIKLGNVSTTRVKGLSGDASLSGKLSLNPKQGAGGSLGASANADVLSVSETLKMGPVTLTATGNVGFGGELSGSLSQDKGLQASAGLTDVVGGAMKIQIGGAGQSSDYWSQCEHRQKRPDKNRY